MGGVGSATAAIVAVAEMRRMSKSQEQERARGQVAAAMAVTVSSGMCVETERGSSVRFQVRNASSVPVYGSRVTIESAGGVNGEYEVGTLAPGQVLDLDALVDVGDSGRGLRASIMFQDAVGSYWRSSDLGVVRLSGPFVWGGG